MYVSLYLYTRTPRKLFNLNRLKAKTKLKSVLVRELLYADDAAIVAESANELQTLIDKLDDACQKFGLSISQNKTKVLAQNSEIVPCITIGGHPLEVVDEFCYLGAKISSNVLLDGDINSRIAKAMGTMAKLKKRVWMNSLLTRSTKSLVYRTCVLSTLLYGSETWSTYSWQEKKLNTFHLRCLRRILDIRWQDRVSNAEVLRRAGCQDIRITLSNRRLSWLGHVRRMPQGRLPQDILYGTLASGQRPAGRPKLRFADVCKRDMKHLQIDPNSWEIMAQDRPTWRAGIKEGSRLAGEERARNKRVEKSVVPSATFICSQCDRVCASRIGLFSHMRACKGNGSSHET